MAEKTDAEYTAEIDKRIHKRLDNIEKGVVQLVEINGVRHQIKDRRIRTLEREIVRLARGVDAVYNHNEAARATVIQHIGIHHRAVVRELLERRKEVVTSNA